MDRKFLVDKNLIATLKPSPYNHEIIAAGTKTGLIIIADWVKKTILFNLRGHDAEIISLDWMYIKKEGEPDFGISLTETINNVQSSDLFEGFDHSNDSNGEEFGVIHDAQTSLDDDIALANRHTHDIVTENSEFDFAEACSALRGEILGEDHEVREPGPTMEDIDREYKETGFKNLNNPPVLPLADSDDSNGMYMDMAHFENTPPKQAKSAEFVVISPSEVDEAALTRGKVILASSARENSIWLWDTTIGVSVSRMRMVHKTVKSKVNTVFIVLSWVNDKTLIANNPNGDLFEWEVSYKSDDK